MINIWGILLLIIIIIVLCTALLCDNEDVKYIMIAIFWLCLLCLCVLALFVKDIDKSETIEADAFVIERKVAQGGYNAGSILDYFSITVKNVAPYTLHYTIKADDFSVNAPCNKAIIEHTWKETKKGIKIKHSDHYILKQVWVTQDIKDKANVELTKPIVVEPIEINSIEKEE